MSQSLLNRPQDTERYNAKDSIVTRAVKCSCLVSKTKWATVLSLSLSFSLRSLSLLFKTGVPFARRIVTSCSIRVARRFGRHIKVNCRYSIRNLSSTTIRSLPFPFFYLRDNSPFESSVYFFPSPSPFPFHQFFGESLEADGFPNLAERESRTNDADLGKE